MCALRDDTQPQTEKTRIAQTYFDSSLNCAQAVAAMVAPQLGLEKTVALRVAAAFGGGMARKGYTCGAVTGALITLGICYGASEPNCPDARQQTYDKASEFMAQFTQRFGTLSCRELLGYDLSTPEGQERHKQERLTVNRCAGFVAGAVEVLENMLAAESKLK